MSTHEEICKEIPVFGMNETGLRSNMPAVNPSDADSHRFCVAPMMEWTDRHTRYFHRLITRYARLYTEMVPAAAIVRGSPARHLQFHQTEHPVALQLGGSDPAELALAARIGADWGYDEINLNVGCPSPRVQSGSFGACLMREPDLVANCVAAMSAVVKIPVTVKCRIAVDDMDPEEGLSTFISKVAEAGCQIFIIHARNAWLKGLSPKENRTVPPLNYSRVHRLKAEFPKLRIVLNGGLKHPQDAEAHLIKLDGIMIGRAAYENPFMLSEVDKLLFSSRESIKSRTDILEYFLPYIEAEIASGTRLSAITRHILGLYHGEPGAKLWRRHLTIAGQKTGASINVVKEAMTMVDTHLKAA